MASLETRTEEGAPMNAQVPSPPGHKMADMSTWDFGETTDGFPLAWYTPEGWARAKAWQDEYRESGQLARDDAVLAVYAVNPAGVLAQALLNDLAVGFRPSVEPK
jgi:hypothetical protein